jgi:hypothetical protein
MILTLLRDFQYKQWLPFGSQYQNSDLNSIPEEVPVALHPTAHGETRWNKIDIALLNDCLKVK